MVQQPGGDASQGGDTAGGGLDAGQGTDPTAPASPFACIANHQPAVVSVPSITPTPTKVRYRVAIVDFRSPNPPIVGASIVGCYELDRNCSTPAPTSAAQMGATPLYNIELPYGFTGFIHITASNYITTNYEFGGALIGTPAGTTDMDGVPLVAGTPIGIPSIPELADFLAGHQPPATLDTKAGILAARFIDCSGNTGPTYQQIVANPYFGRAASVKIQVKSPTGLGYTLLKNVPIFSDPPVATDFRGVAGYANMAPGNYLISGILLDGTEYGDTAAQIVDNTLTLIEVRTDSRYEIGR
ncbi:MAG: hypothetical protein JOZ69_22130 [Myxococcales bacterium]|nr:hypothetical protein [Myxococcales bacterium]